MTRLHHSRLPFGFEHVPILLGDRLFFDKDRLPDVERDVASHV